MNRYVSGRNYGMRNGNYYIRMKTVTSYFTQPPLESSVITHVIKLLLLVVFENYVSNLPISHLSLTFT